jgi:hypothetical protein
MSETPWTNEPTPLTDATSFAGYAGYRSATHFARDLDAYAQHVRNCEGVGVWPDSPEAWANRPWHRRQNTTGQGREAYPAPDCSQGGCDA